MGGNGRHKVLTFLIKRSWCGITRTGHPASCSFKIMQETEKPGVNLDWARIPNLIAWGGKHPHMNCSIQLDWWTPLTCVGLRGSQASVSLWPRAQLITCITVLHITDESLRACPSAPTHRAEVSRVTVWSSEVKTKGDSDSQIQRCFFQRAQRKDEGKKCSWKNKKSFVNFSLHLIN